MILEGRFEGDQLAESYKCDLYQLQRKMHVKRHVLTAC